MLLTDSVLFWVQQLLSGALLGVKLLTSWGHAKLDSVSDLKCVCVNLVYHCCIFKNIFRVVHIVRLHNTMHSSFEIYNLNTMPF